MNSWIWFEGLTLRPWKKKRTQQQSVYYRNKDESQTLFSQRESCEPTKTKSAGSHQHITALQRVSVCRISPKLWETSFHLFLRLAAQVALAAPT